jgi:hypothetical protein
MSPGGVGVDIKHNSYDRYLNRIKGKAPLRRGIIPPNYGQPIPFNCAYPIYGGKTVKTSIVNNCNCPDSNDNDTKQDYYIYSSPLNDLQDQIFSVKFSFHVGDIVRVQEHGTDVLNKAQIIDIENGMYTVKFEDDGVIQTVPANALVIFFDCNCVEVESLADYILENQFGGKTSSKYFDSVNNIYCGILNKIAASEIL